MNLQPGVKVTESKGTENGAAPKKDNTILI